VVDKEKVMSMVVVLSCRFLSCGAIVCVIRVAAVLFAAVSWPYWGCCVVYELIFVRVLISLLLFVMIVSLCILVLVTFVSGCSVCLL